MLHNLLALRSGASYSSRVPKRMMIVVPEELWSRVKAGAALERKTLAVYVSELLTRGLKAAKGDRK